MKIAASAIAQQGNSCNKPSKLLSLVHYSNRHRLDRIRRNTRLGSTSSALALNLAKLHEGTRMSQNSGKIFVLYPRGLRTGGPEALHQLVDMLRALGQEAYLVPHSSTLRARRVDEYKLYDAPERRQIVDAAENTVVVPELYASSLSNVKNATPVCWWLSIDYAPTFAAERMALRVNGGNLEKLARSIVPQLRAFKNGVTAHCMKKRPMVHLAQSSYAWSFLFSRLNVVPSILSDYTPGEEFTKVKGPSRNPRLVTFNPAKGGDIVRQVMDISDPSIEWRPIEKMSRTEVVRTLQESAVYLDLGFHPGKDRMPREAALSGALTVVSRRGAGAYFADVPIPWEHKIHPDSNEVKATAAMLPRLMDAWPAHVSKQDNYREVIANEKSRFQREVYDIFIAKRLGKDACDYVTP